MLVKPLFEKQSSTEIEIYNSTLFHEARQEYKNKNYFKALELLEILETFYYQDIQRYVLSLIKLENPCIKRRVDNKRLLINYF